jgi:5-methylcytosine-specific restriction endonuclease McrA
MRFELILLLITGFIVANIYTEGKYIKLMMSWKKYYQMAGVVFGALMLYTLIKKNPLRAKEIITTSNDYIKYLPVDRDTSTFLSPILDFTSKQNFFDSQYQSIDGGNYNYPVVSMPDATERVGETRMLHSGKKTTKRSVSETKKKFVASRQNWCCGDCQQQLSAWFEVDHKMRLEHGGSNHIDNLVALCRECHGKKTAMENL